MKPVLIKEFEKLTLEKFRRPLTQYGFKREQKESTDFSCKIVYGNGQRYIRTSANIHPRDYPPYFNIMLGEGGRNFFESDWNSVALWRMIRWIQNDSKAGEYSLEQPVNLGILLQTALDDLLTYGRSFLSGDMTIFYQVRADQNKDREPYKIHTPDASGRYITYDDSMSTELKKKFSKPDSSG